MKIRAAVCFTLLFTVLLFSACYFPLAEEVVGADYQAGSIQSWIDAPLDGSIIPFATYEIVLHAFDPAGVMQVELSANGNLLANLPNPDSGKQLATLKYSWMPASPGNYTLRARAQSAGGGWGSEAIVVVTVSDLTLTPVNTLTATVTLTPAGRTPPPTGTPTATVTSTAATLSFTPRISSNSFYYGTCGSDQVTIQVLAPGDTVHDIILFKNLEDQSGGTSTGWDEGAAMTPSGNGWFSRTISSRSVAGADRFKKAWLLYQFVATDSANKIIGRSQVYSDIALLSCGESQPPVRVTYTPTKVPSIIAPPIFRRPSPTPIR